MSEVTLLDWQAKALQCKETVRELAKMARATRHLEMCDAERREQAIRRKDEIDRIRLKFLKRTKPLRFEVLLDGTEFAGEWIPKASDADEILMMWFAVSCPIVMYRDAEAIVEGKRFRGLVMSVQPLTDGVALVRVGIRQVEELVSL